MLGARLMRNLVLISFLIPCLFSEDSAQDFEFRNVSYPGGLMVYARWVSKSRTLTYKSVDIGSDAIIVEKLQGSESTVIDADNCYQLDRIAELIKQLPDQKSLPADGVSVWDGGAFFFRYFDGSQWVSLAYNNPSEHNRIMDAACLGVVEILLWRIKYTLAPHLTNR